MNNLSSPTKMTWYIALALAVISFISLLITIPVLTGLSPWLALIGLVLMLLAARMTNL